MVESEAKRAAVVFEDWFVADLESQMPAAVRKRGFKAVLAHEESGRPAMFDGLFPFTLKAKLPAGAWAEIKFSTGNVRVAVNAIERPGNVVVAEETTFAKAVAQFERWDREAQANFARFWESMAAGVPTGPSYFCERPRSRCMVPRLFRAGLA